MTTLAAPWPPGAGMYPLVEVLGSGFPATVAAEGTAGRMFSDGEEWVEIRRVGCYAGGTWLSAQGILGTQRHVGS